MNEDLGRLRRLGPYTLVRRLGGGSMGTVFLADGPEGAIAVKVLHPHLAPDRDAVLRFERDAGVARHVAHPNVVRTFAHRVLEEGGRTWCLRVMEHVEGHTLREKMETWGPAPDALVREIARQVAAGLEAIHAAGMVHEDLRPENVMITEGHRVLVMDLGLAQYVDEASPLSPDGSFAGSLAYAAPERLRGEPASPRSDLYALGILLHELLTGELPFSDDDVQALLYAHHETPPPRVDAQRPEVSPFLSEVVDVLLAKRPDARFASAGELGRVLAEAERSPWWVTRCVRRNAGRRAVPNVPVRRDTRLRGRSADLALLTRAWERAREGQGQVLWLVGEDGIGKTGLVDAFLRSVDPTDANLLYGSYAPSGGMGAISDALLARFGTGGLEEALTPYLRNLPGLVADFAAGVLQQAPRGRGEPLSDDALEAVLVQLMRGLAAERPLAWVVEDLHFAEPAARRRVLALARGLVDHRVLLVLTSRAGLPASDWGELHHPYRVTRHALDRLGYGDVRRLLKDVLGSESLAERLGSRVAIASDGIPFFVLEIVRDLKAKAYVAELPGGRWVEARPVDEIVVPSAIRDLVSARLASLTKSERALVDVGAVQGHAFDPVLSAEVLDREAVDVLQDLAELERRCGVVRSSGRGVRFDHHQIQVLVYEALPLALREAYHAGIAEALERRAGSTPDGATRAALCAHLLKGGQGIAALVHLDAALDHLTASYRQDEAVALMRDALAVDGLVVGADRAELLRRTADRLHLLGRVEEERRALDEAVLLADAARDPVLQARVRADLGRLFQRSARYEEAIAVLLRAIRLAEEAEDAGVAIRAVRRLGGVYYAQGRLDEARVQYERQRRLAAAAGDVLEEAHAVGNLGTIHSDQSRYDEARGCFEHHLAAVEREGDAQGASVAHGNLGILLLTQGHYEEAREHLEQQLGLARAMGDRQGEARATGSLGYLAGMQGRFPEALARHEHHLRITREIGDRRSEGIATANLGNVFVNLGRYEEARTCFEDWLEISREIGSRSGEARANGQLGFVDLVTGRINEARTHFERWLEMARALGDRAGESYALGYLADIALERGRFDDARVRYEQRMTLSRGIGDRRGESIAHAGLGSVDLALGHAARALRHFERRLNLARALHDRQIEGSSHASLGLAYAAEGRRREAERAHERSLDLSREIGDRRGEALALCALGRLHAEDGRYEASRTRLEHSLQVAAAIRDPRCEAEARFAIGRLLVEMGEVQPARSMLQGALDAARELDWPAGIVLAACRLARLPGGDVGCAVKELARLGDRLGVADRLAARLDLWEVTGDASHLEGVRTDLDTWTARASPEWREAADTHVPVCRRAREALEGAD